MLADPLVVQDKICLESCDHLKKKISLLSPAAETSVFTWFAEHYKDLTIQSGIVKMHDYTQHGSTSCLLHSVAVSYYSYRLALALRMKINYRDLIRGALLHDYFLYNWREPNTPKWHGFTHPKTALKNAKAELILSEIECDIIEKHMFPLTIKPPKFKESLLVCLVDKGCAVYEAFSRKKPYFFLNNELVKDTISPPIIPAPTKEM